ncbi:hypothetical protein C8J57DRAFT_1226166 [Mycena rebaudengoi]|nr:hypothetical protein C8J57DRAFT_1226166 [Mycena rebaudengoi]
MLYNIKTAVLIAVVCLMASTNVSAIVPCGRCAIERRAEDVTGSIAGGKAFAVLDEPNEFLTLCMRNDYELEPDRYTLVGYPLPVLEQPLEHSQLFNDFIASKDMDVLQRFACSCKDTAKNILSSAKLNDSEKWRARKWARYTSAHWLEVTTVPAIPSPFLNFNFSGHISVRVMFGVWSKFAPYERNNIVHIRAVKDQVTQTCQVGC